MIQSVAGSNTLKQKSDEAFKELCSEKHIARLYRTQVDYLLANWTEYDISRPDAEISDGRAILRILADDWKECLELNRKGEIKADRILLEKPVHQSLKRKNPFKKIAFIAYNVKKFFSSCFCPPASFTSRIDTKGGPRGLVNEGNDCFFNSLFQQIVWGDPVFREALCKKHPIS